MKTTFTLLLLSVLVSSPESATVASHLQYFGYTAIDCGWDDPHDPSDINTYLAEVDSFSNIAHLCVYSHTDDITGRVSTMNDHCMKALLGIETVFFIPTADTAPYGQPGYGLSPDYAAQWQTFKTINASVLNSSRIGCFYVMDEPYWRGVTFDELNTVCALVKGDFPDIPVCFIEAYTMVDIMQVPVTADWIGFDRYGHVWPHLDQVYLADVETLKARVSAPHQRGMLIIDDQWLQFYGDAGVPPESIATMVTNYYTLAKADTFFIGMIGYLWPGGLDGPDHLGVRDLPQNVIDENIRIGKEIIANNVLCGTSPVRLRNTPASAPYGTPHGYYDLRGHRLNRPATGICLHYGPDGRLRKSFIMNRRSEWK